MINDKINKVLEYLGVNMSKTESKENIEEQTQIHTDKLNKLLYLPLGEDRLEAFRCFIKESEEQELFTKESLSQKIDRYQSIGIAYAELQDYVTSTLYYNKAIELTTNMPTIYYNRARNYTMLGENQNAIIDLKKAIALEATNADFYCNLGNVYEDLGMYKEAIDCYSEAIHINPYSSVNFSFRAGICFKLNEFQQAISDFSSAIELDPYDAQLVFNRGWALANLGKLDEAVIDFENCLELDPENFYGQKEMALSALDKLKA